MSQYKEHKEAAASFMNRNDRPHWDVDERSGACGASCDRQLCLPLLHQFDAIVQDIDIPHFIVDHKSTLRFPETLLLLLVQAEREAVKKGLTPEKSCIAWTLDGRGIIVRNKNKLVNKLLPMAFSKAQFSSFTRKLYRWGFRLLVKGESYTKQIKAGDKAFWHPYFQRDNTPLMLNMKSTTAQGTRRALEAQKYQRDSAITPPVTDNKGTSANITGRRLAGAERIGLLESGVQTPEPLATQETTQAVSVTPKAIFLPCLEPEMTANKPSLSRCARGQVSSLDNVIPFPLLSRSAGNGTTDMDTFDQMTEALVLATATVQSGYSVGAPSQSPSIGSISMIHAEQAHLQLLQSYMNRW